MSTNQIAYHAWITAEGLKSTYRIIRVREQQIYKQRLFWRQEATGRPGTVRGLAQGKGTPFSFYMFKERQSILRF